MGWNVAGLVIPWGSSGTESSSAYFSGRHAIFVSLCRALSISVGCDCGVQGLWDAVHGEALDRVWAVHSPCDDKLRSRYSVGFHDSDFTDGGRSPEQAIGDRSVISHESDDGVHLIAGHDRFDGVTTKTGRCCWRLLAGLSDGRPALQAGWEDHGRGVYKWSHTGSACLVGHANPENPRPPKGLQIWLCGIGGSDQGRECSGWRRQTDRKKNPINPMNPAASVSSTRSSYIVVSLCGQDVS